MELDKLSRSIITALQENARMTFAEIGRRVGLSAPAVAERIAKMEQDKVITGFHVAVNPASLGYTICAIVMFSADGGHSEPFYKFIANHPDVVHCDRVTGDPCAILKILAKDTSHLEKIISSFGKYGKTTTSIILGNVVSRN
jgi:Lrp/AsnC family transcriptional regulator, leucine-responsive regulatory protein